jgi:hypothetical protein
MIKVVYCSSKKTGLSDEEFFCYWEGVHGPIGSRIPGLRKLVQSHRVSVPGDKRRPDYDGVAEWPEETRDCSSLSLLGMTRDGFVAGMTGMGGSEE